jgi:hypothetical protein
MWRLIEAEKAQPIVVQRAPFYPVDASSLERRY